MTFIKLWLFPLRLFFQQVLFLSCAFVFSLLQVELVLHKLQTTRKKHHKHCHYWDFQTASTVFMVLYLWGSSCGDDDVSPTHWLSLDRDHLHSAIPMFGKALGFSKQIHFSSFPSGLCAAFRPVEKKNYSWNIHQSPTKSVSHQGWNLKSGFVRRKKKIKKTPLIHEAAVLLNNQVTTSCNRNISAQL